MTSRAQRKLFIVFVLAGIALAGYLTYRALKAAVQQHGARSGSVVVLDVTTGEVLAIGNQPGFNPNGRELSAERLTYDFDVAGPGGDDEDWVDFATGEFREPMRVAGNDSTVVEIPIEFTYSEVGDVIRSVIDRGTLRYRVRGSVDVSRPLRAEVPFSKSGTVALMSGR